MRKLLPGETGNAAAAIGRLNGAGKIVRDCRPSPLRWQAGSWSPYRVKADSARQNHEFDQRFCSSVAVMQARADRHRRG